MQTSNQKVTSLVSPETLVQRARDLVPKLKERPMKTEHDGKVFHAAPCDNVCSAGRVPSVWAPVRGGVAPAFRG